ncbi:mucin-3B-like [Sinocyclocheilus grahami]|uniref:mucin-3B-like n=1 Tax=Sinocyclocheilus grahami TaxID=75366 RepID=UPI0007AD2781|nr:PREDICTED: mucin-3B-like [Sinocyclocheilus grahami]
MRVAGGGQVRVQQRAHFTEEEAERAEHHRIHRNLNCTVGTLSENKKDTTKSKDHTISHNVPKLVTTTLTTKVKIQTHAASSKSNSANQILSSTTKPVVDGAQKPVPSLQDTLSEKKNSTTKSKVNAINLNVQKPVTTLSNTKMKNQTHPTSSKPSSISQTPTSTTKPAIDGVQNPGPTLPGKPNEKKYSTAKSTALTGSPNLPNIVTVALNTKMKNQTHPTSSKISSVNQTLPSTTKLVADESTLSKKKKSTVKSTVQTFNVKVSKTVTTVLNTKTKKQTQSTSSKVINVNQRQGIVQKHVPSLQDPLSEKKNSTVKSTAQTIKVAATLLKTKMKDQTQSASSTTSRVNQTLPLSMTPDVVAIQKPVQSVQNTLCEKKNSTTKSVNSINVEKPTTRLLKTKMKDQSQTTSSTTNRVNQTLSSSTKPDVDTVQKPVQTIQNTLTEKKNSTTKQVNTINLKVEKIVTTLLKTKMKNQTQSTSSKNSSIDQTVPSSLKPAVDAVQKPVSSYPASTGEKKNTTAKLVGHTIHVNASKPANTKMKDQTYSASSKPSHVGQTLSSTPKPAVDVQKPGPSLQKNNSTSKSTAQTISHTVPKLTTLVNTKMKNQTHPTSSETQTLQSTSKLVVDESALSKKKYSTVKSLFQNINVNVSKPLTTSLHAKTKKQTQSTSKMISGNHTLPSTTKSIVDEITLSKKKTFTVKSTPQIFYVNLSKPVTTSLNTKIKTKTQSPSSEISNVNQSVASTAKPVVDRVQNPTKDKPAESSPVIVITGGCVPQTESQTNVGNVTKVREMELSLNPGSPLVMTHHINLVQGACTGGCETEMATLRDRVEFLEKEMAAIKKMCVQCSGEQCPKNCSGQGKCEEGRCVCFQGFSGPDCSGKTCPSNCNRKGKCVKGKCVCQTGYTGLDCSKAVDKKIAVTVETVTMKMPTANPDTKPVKAKPDKTIFVKKIDPKKNTTAEPTVKPSPTVYPGKVQSNNTKSQEQAKEGKTAIIKLDFDKQSQTHLTDKSKKNNLKDEPVYQNQTQRSVKKLNGTNKILENGFKGTKESSNATMSMTKVTMRTAGDQAKESRTINVPSTEKDKQLLRINVTTTLQAEKSDKHVFQRRMDGSTDFFRSWRDYSKGFGLLSGEFWLGNDILHTLTSRTPMSLRIDLCSGNDTAFAHYANFKVSSEANHYVIELSGYFGTAGDSMKYHNGRPFSTIDKDPNTLSIPCAKAYMGGWWYKNCYMANLNGLYASYSDNKGVVWIDWKGKDASLPFTEMKLRPSYISQMILTTPTTQG